MRSDCLLATVTNGLEITALKTVQNQPFKAGYQNCPVV
jgi:hypothetical protein